MVDSSATHGRIHGIFPYRDSVGHFYGNLLYRKIYKRLMDPMHTCSGGFFKISHSCLKFYAWKDHLGPCSLRRFSGPCALFQHLLGQLLEDLLTPSMPRARATFAIMLAPMKDLCERFHSLAYVSLIWGGFSKQSPFRTFDFLAILSLILGLLSSKSLLKMGPSHLQNLGKSSSNLGLPRGVHPPSVGTGPLWVRSLSRKDIEKPTCSDVLAMACNPQKPTGIITITTDPMGPMVNRSPLPV